MASENNNSKLTRNWVWILLTLLTVILIGGIVYLNNIRRVALLEDTSTEGEISEFSLDSIENNNISISLNILDPSPVYINENFSLDVSKYIPSYVKTFYVDDTEVCLGSEECIISIDRSGHHTLKICLNELGICDSININVLIRVQNKQKDIDNPQVSSKSETPTKPIVTTNDVTEKKIQAISFECNGNKPKISVNNSALLYGSPIAFKVDDGNCLDSEMQFDWDFDSDGIFDSKDIKSPTFKFPSVGIYNVRLRITDGPSKQNYEDIKKIQIKISESQLKDLFDPILKVGQLGGTQKAGTIKTNAAQKAETELLNLVKSPRIIIKDESGIEINDLETFIGADLKSPNKFYGINILKIDYDNFNGKIKSIKCKLQKS